MRIAVRGAGGFVAAVYATVGLVVGVAGAFVSLEAPLVGMLLAAAAGVLLVRQASRQRWFACGGFLLGLGTCAAGFLSPALTNHDPAVSYDPSTVPFFFVGVVIALCGATMLVCATHTTRHHGPA